MLICDDPLPRNNHLLATTFTFVGRGWPRGSSDLFCRLLPDSGRMPRGPGMGRPRSMWPGQAAQGRWKEGGPGYLHNMQCNCPWLVVYLSKYLREVQPARGR